MTWRRILLVLGVIALVAQCVGLYSPSGPPSTPGMPSDKIGHLIGFVAPAALFVAARVDWRLVAALSVAQAVISELVQGFLLPDRTGDLADLLTDLAGTVVGVLLGLLARRWVPVTAGGPAERPAEGTGDLDA